MSKSAIAHPTLLAAVVAGVVVYFLWQRAQAQARAAAILPGQGGSIFGPGLPTGDSTSATSSGTTLGAGDVITIGPITPSNIPQPSVSGNFPQASSS
jgi:hypothetical protein